MPLLDGNAVVARAATPAPLAAVSTAFRWLRVTARPANTGKVALGSSRALATAGRESGTLLAAGESVILSAQYGVDDLSQVYVDATVNGEGVTYAYAA